MQDFDLIGSLISLITQYVSIPFIISTNLLTYISIKIGEVLNKEKIFSTVEKRIITGSVTTILLVVFYFFKVSNSEVLFLSAILSPFTYSLVIKKIFELLGISIYRKSDIEIIQESSDTTNA